MLCAKCAPSIYAPSCDCEGKLDLKRNLHGDPPSSASGWFVSPVSSDNLPDVSTPQDNSFPLTRAFTRGLPHPSGLTAKRLMLEREDIVALGPTLPSVLSDLAVEILTHALTSIDRTNFAVRTLTPVSLRLCPHGRGTTRMRQSCYADLW